MRRFWIFARRPLFVAFLTGCAISLLAARRLSAYLIVGEAINWSVIPLLQLLALAAVVFAGPRPKLPFSQVTDEFFRGDTPWLLWLLAVAMSGAPAGPKAMRLWLASMAPVAAWCGYTEARYLRTVLERGPAQVVRDMILLRVICWGGVIWYFFGFDIPPELASRFGL
jgi:hypothetical protein